MTANVPRWERSVAEVQEEHRLRLDFDWSKLLVPRPFKHRPTPQTAIIAQAAQRLIAKRQETRVVPIRKKSGSQVISTEAREHRYTRGARKP